MASAVSAPSAIAPVSRSHRAHGVRFMIASAKRAATSGSSSPCSAYTDRIASAYPSFQGPMSAAGEDDG